MTEPTPTDPLSELRDQIRATTQAAERLAAETADARAYEVPPAGWASPDDQAERQQELQALVALVDALRDLVPDELKVQLRDVLRQLLLLTRTLIDWWVERMDAPAPARPADAAPRAHEIPLD